MSSKVLIRVDKAMILPDNGQWTNRVQIPSESSSRLYVVAQHKSGRYWGCSCPGWILHRNCKHLRTLALPGHQLPHEVKMIAVEE